MQHAMDHDVTTIITLDGDGQHEPEDIPVLIAMHRRDPLAIVVGARLHDTHRIPLARYIANRVANFWISWAAGQAIDDSQSGFRVYPASVLRAAGNRCDHAAGFAFESEVLIEAGRDGILIRPVPVSVRYGRHLRKSHFRRGRDIARITRMVAGKLLARRMDLSGLIRSFKTPLSPPKRSAFIQPSGQFDRQSCRRRILFLAESVTLAHVARAIALARALDPHHYDIHLACDGRYLPLFGPLPFAVHSIHSISGARFQDRLIKGDPLYTADELRRYVTDDIRLLTSLDPDVVVGDFRLSLSVSARLAGIPYLAIANAHWSPYARPRFIVPDLAIIDRFGPRLGQALFSVMRPVVFPHHAYALNKVRRDYGLPSVGYSLPHMFTDADEVLYADLAELVPTFDRPGNHHYLGPILWSPNLTPPWWDTVPEDRPMAYVSLGSSGRCDLLPPILDTLQRLGITAIVSTAGRKPPPYVQGHVWTSEYIPGLKAAERADIVICNGGSATAYQALAAGVPILGVPYNLDQYLMMFYVQKFGAGEYVRSGQVSVDTLTQVVARMLSTASYRQQAESLRASIRTHECGERFIHVLKSLLGAESDNTSSAAAQCTGSLATLPTRDLDAQQRSGNVRHVPGMQY
jgi:UDP:flavonoid glycosyltransferase YjiC (YdhE family)